MALGLRQLRYFIAIADAGALSRAAERLNVAQSALSHHISEMERSLDTKLFERRARGVNLTAAGTRLYEHASAILSAIEKAEADVRSLTEEASGPVSVGLSHTAISVVSIDVMKAVREQYPKVFLTLVEGLSPSLIERVMSGNLDMAVCYNPPKDGRITSEPLLEEDLFLVGRTDVIGRSVSPMAFVDIPQGMVLGLNPVPASRAIIQAQILRNQISTSQTLEIDSLAAMRKALEAGLGCAILAKSSVQAELAEKRVHARRIVNPVLTRTLAIVTLSERPQTRSFCEVGRVVSEVVTHAAANGSWPNKKHYRPKPRATI